MNFFFFNFTNPQMSQGKPRTSTPLAPMQQVLVQLPEKKINSKAFEEQFS